MENITKTSTHPLILVAAGAVTIASLAAAAHFSGLIGKNEPAPAQLASAPPAVVAPATTPAPAPVAAPVAKAEDTVAAPQHAPASTKHASNSRPRSSEPSHRARSQEATGRSDDSYRRVASSDAGVDVIAAPRSYPAQNSTTQAAPPVCRDCGTVESVNEVKTQGEGTGLGAVAGGVLGGVLGNQVGRGRGKDVATVAGVIGGAVAGHQVEKSVRSEKQYHVNVRFDDGTYKTYTLTNTNWRSGDRVRLSNGSLSAL
ncbi:MAG: glycine zipper 2TM domain-containing protein [Betaproteobacteria bacterium]